MSKRRRKMSTNSNLPKDELISKLEAISVLRDKALSIKQKMENFVPEDIYERKVVVPVFPGEYKSDDEREEIENSIDHSENNAIEQMAESYDRLYAPQKPVEPKIKEFEYRTDVATTNKQTKWKLYSYISGGVSGFFFLSIILGTADGAWFTIFAISIIAALLCLFFRNKLKNEIEAEKKKKEEALFAYTEHKNKLTEEYQEKLESYESEYAAYQLRRQDFLDEYVNWREIYLESEDEEAQIEEQLEADRVAAVEKIRADEFTPALQEVVEVNNDLITNEYLPAIDIIIDLLKSGRADDLKEAINLYEDILYRERQLKLQREQEEQRRYEEECRRQDEERRYQEEKQFREGQERQRRKEEEQRLNFEKKKYEEQKAMENEERLRKQREESAQQSKLTHETRLQCDSCSCRSGCYLVYKRANCPSYRPKS